MASRALAAVVLALTVLATGLAIVVFAYYTVVFSPKPLTYYVAVDLGVEDGWLVLTGYGCGVYGLDVEDRPQHVICQVTGSFRISSGNASVDLGERVLFTWGIPYGPGHARLLDKRVLELSAIADALRSLNTTRGELVVRVCVKALTFWASSWHVVDWPFAVWPLCPCYTRIPVELRDGEVTVDLYGADVEVLWGRDGVATLCLASLGPSAVEQLGGLKTAPLVSQQEESLLLNLLVATAITALLAALVSVPMSLRILKERRMGPTSPG